jgi:hypothetical protein
MKASRALQARAPSCGSQHQAWSKVDEGALYVPEGSCMSHMQSNHRAVTTLPYAHMFPALRPQLSRPAPERGQNTSMTDPQSEGAGRHVTCAFSRRVHWRVR